MGIIGILEEIEGLVRKPKNKITFGVFSTYIGPISYSKKMMVYQKQMNDMPLILNPFDRGDSEKDELTTDLEFRLCNKPMGKVEMTPDPIKNLAFLKKELECWTGQSPVDLNDAPWMQYPELWSGVPNVSVCAYEMLMSEKYKELLNKLKLITKTEDSDIKYAFNRTLVVNFPSASFCPISFGFCFDYRPDSNGDFRAVVLVMINFRSLEVTRNLANDLYLFLGFLRILLYSSNPNMEESIPIVELTITSMDAHIIDL